MAERAPFDGLSDDYDRFRPRYPRRLLEALVRRLPAGPVEVADIGAGTGIELEDLLPLLGDRASCAAVDISDGMVATGRVKFPDVRWSVGRAEPFLEAGSGLGLVVAAQSFQWMERERTLRAAHAALVPGGVVAILQNNRDHEASPFLADYEALLEKRSPGYSRHYRDFDFRGELEDVFLPDGVVGVEATRWVRPMPAADFEGMTRSSTQMQRALEAHGEQVTDEVRALIRDHFGDGDVQVAYRTELFTGVRAERAAP